MNLSKKQKRVLISIPIIIIAISGVFPLVEWLMGGDHHAIHLGLAAACGGSIFSVLSLLFNWPRNLRGEE